MKSLRIAGLLLASAAALSALADTYGRYAVTGSYMTDADEGAAGIYFQTVAEQGGSSPAYAVIGGVYPLRASSALKGDLTIPETLLGLPVRKIADGAFTGQSGLRSVTLPANLREIGDRAFAWCTSLTRVAFAGPGVASVGEFCFSNCVSLTTVDFPASLEYLAPNVFALCDSLSTVGFEGNAPRLDPPGRDTQASYFGEKRWTGGTAPARAVFRIRAGTYGWTSPTSTAVPERWPLSHGFMNAHPVQAEATARAGFSVRIATAGGNP